LPVVFPLFATPAMSVIKRSGAIEDVSAEKLQLRLQRLSSGLDTRHVDVAGAVNKVLEGLHEGATTADVDSLAAETCAYMSQSHPDYSILAARVAVSRLHKATCSSFSESCRTLYQHTDSGRPAPLISQEFYELSQLHGRRLDVAINHEADMTYDFFAFKTLERSYLMKCNGVVVERPQYMLMRCALGIHYADIDAVVETYELLSKKMFTHATPTLFNAGTLRPQMSSCFLLSMKEDSIEGIFDTLSSCSKISKSAGGIGLAISNIRCTGSYIAGSNGTSNGLVPMLRVFNETARFVEQGGGKRKGSFAVYLEPWHADVFDFLDLRKNHGKEEQRARDLFYGLWIPDLFMQRVEENGQWTLFCPQEAPGLQDAVGKEFKRLYEQYEAEGKGRQVVPAQTLWFRIMESQVETGTPYMLYKDACNEKSNQKNVGTIRCSNLCTEIIQFTSPDEVAVCNLASIALPAFVAGGKFEFERFAHVVRVATRNLNKVIDRNYYPVAEAERSNRKHRPIGLGVQGLADAFMMMRLPFESDEARQLNKHIFETLYFAALDASCDLAQKHGPYQTYEGSPISEGILQFDMWNVQPDSGLWDWEGLRSRIRDYGVRNSLLVAPMPTASTAQILGNNESFEPYTQNMYTRRVLAGEFVQVNRHLLKDLVERGLWGPDMKQSLIANNGSVQSIEQLPKDLKELYKTVWEIKQKRIVEMAADRGAYIDQSQSLNIHMADCTTAKLSSMHFFGWKKGLKTGQYYLRTQAAADAIKFTVEATTAKLPVAEVEPACLSCSG